MQKNKSEIYESNGQVSTLFDKHDNVHNYSKYECKHRTEKLFEATPNDFELHAFKKKNKFSSPFHLTQSSPNSS